MRIEIYTQAHNLWNVPVEMGKKKKKNLIMTERKAIKRGTFAN